MPMIEENLAQAMRGGDEVRGRTTTTNFATFDFTDADITVKSSDGIIFRLHRKNLEVATGAFQLADSQTNSDEIVVLSEPAAVLMILFQFIYPQKHPRLEEGAFESLLAVAEAVEKYKIFSAMGAIPQHPLETLAHGLRHNYSKMANESALFVCRRPLTEVADKLPLRYLPAWCSYYEAWRTVFALPPESVLAVTQSGACMLSSSRKSKANSPRQCCLVCYAYLYNWLGQLATHSTPDNLNEALECPKFAIQMARDDAQRACCSACNSDSCQHLDFVAKCVKKRVKSMPLLSHYLSTTIVP